MSQIKVTVDAHVHIYAPMSIQCVLDEALRNFLAIAGDDAGCEKIFSVFIADPDNVGGFDRLRNAGIDGGDPIANWRVESVGAVLVLARHVSGAQVVCVKGQQLITAEGLEVLAIGCNNKLVSGRKLSETVESARHSEGWAIVAWGAGKWFGKRGRLVTDFVRAESSTDNVMLADNGGRPKLWNRVPQFDLARELGMQVLAGTDPLPLEGEEARIGTYGFEQYVDTLPDFGSEFPFLSLLASNASQRAIVGETLGVGRFIRNQVGIRLHRY